MLILLYYIFGHHFQSSWSCGKILFRTVLNYFHLLTVLYFSKCIPMKKQMNSGWSEDKYILSKFSFWVLFNYSFNNLGCVSKTNDLAIQFKCYFHHRIQLNTVYNLKCWILLVVKLNDLVRVWRLLKSWRNTWLVYIFLKN